ncbi:ANK-REP-region domain-containing protein [Favolaschia claudopus]|uniref:ANK-REP-region domain-containing protein n=1 Tax=Favolaschia claudopus TaxID=2862362 RepID=A0AAW0D0Y0_9AGAR
MPSTESIHSSVSSILKQLSTAQKGFGELKDFISSSKEHKFLCNELKDLELSMKAVQSAIDQELLSSSNDEIQDLVASFGSSLDEFIQESQVLTTSILGMPSTTVDKFSIKTRTFRKQIITQFPDDTLTKYQEKIAQMFESVQAKQELSSINVTAHGGMGGAGGWGGHQGGLGGRGEGAQLTFNNTNTVYLAAKISSTEDKKNKILEWLTTINFFQRQDVIFETWQKGTGQWFLSLFEFRNWLSNSEKVLWCEGPPGAGKTVITSLVVKHIEDSFQTSKAGLAYIYINHKELRNQSPTALFASLCKQLLLDKPLPLMLQDLWQYHSKRKTQPTLADVLRVLEIVLLEYSNIYLIIDALDEYFDTAHGHRAAFIQNLIKLVKQFPIHLMITTRPNNMAQDRFSNVQLVSMQAKKSDITLYIESQFNNSDNMFQLLKNRPQLKADIQLAIVEDVDGIFLLAKLRMDYLGAQPTVALLQEARKTLPSTLSTAYQATMTRINIQAEGLQRLACKALMWISNAFRPLSVAELCQVLAIDPGDTSLDLDKVPHIETILAVCGGLVSIDKELSVVRLVHYSAQNWVASQFPNAHKEIALTSFQYLEFHDFDGLWILDEEKHSFAVYGQYCLEHTKRTNCEMELFSWVERFARKAYRWRVLWQSKHTPFWKYEPWPAAKKDYQTLVLAAAGNLQTMTQHLVNKEQSEGGHHKWALALAGYAGHSEIIKLLLGLNVVNPEWGMHPAIQGKQTEIIKMLLDKGADMNIVDTKYGSALQAAAYKESESIVKMLLDAGANMNIAGGEFGTALQVAAYGKSEPIVKMLLDAGADTNIVGGEYGTALQAAAYRESEPIVGMLLDAGADTDIVSGKYGTALQAAAQIVSEPILKMLLGKGADVNMVGGKYGTALQAAAYMRSEPIVKMLLDAGADMNIGSSLQAAAYGGSETVVRMLLDAGTDMNNVDSQYGTTLQAAVLVRSEPIIKMLLDAGADVNIVSSVYGTALQAAADMRSQSIVKILLDAGAETNIVSGKYGTALEAAAYRESDSIVKMLLDKGASVNTAGSKYGTALQVAAYMRCEAVIDMLLDAGADTNIVGGEYGTALQAAAYRESEPIVKMLLNAGADVNIVGGTYGTVLQAAAYMECEHIVKILLHAGANVNISGGKFGTALQAAAYRKSEHISRVLLDARADVNIVGGEYGTALQAAAYRKSEPILKMLLDAGADINIVSGTYGTALQVAAYGKSEPIVKMLLDAGADMNIVSSEYGTVLQAAAYMASEPIVKMLLDAGADMNIVSSEYGTALQAAAHRESQSIVQLLLHKGAGVNIVGGAYGTALQAATYSESEPIVKMLLDKGADVNIVGGVYGTALQAAAYGNSGAIVTMLLDAGAEVNISGGRYGTPLQAAVAWNEPKSQLIVNLLLAAGADTNLKGGTYRSALQAAQALGQQTIEEILLKAGATPTDLNEEEPTTDIIVPQIPISSPDVKERFQIVDPFTIMVSVLLALLISIYLGSKHLQY